MAGLSAHRRNPSPKVPDRQRAQGPPRARRSDRHVAWLIRRIVSVDSDGSACSHPPRELVGCDQPTNGPRADPRSRSPNRPEGLLCNGRTRELERDGRELPLFAFAEVALDKAALHKHRLPRCVRSGHPDAAGNDGPVAPPPDEIHASRPNREHCRSVVRMREPGSGGPVPAMRSSLSPVGEATKQRLGEPRLPAPGGCTHNPLLRHPRDEARRRE